MIMFDLCLQLHNQPECAVTIVRCTDYKHGTRDSSVLISGGMFQCTVVEDSFYSDFTFSKTLCIDNTSSSTP